MKRCLSDKALMRLQAGDGSAEQRAHLSVCGACGDRDRSLDRELETVRHVLLYTDEPGASVARRPSWVSAVAIAASLVVTVAVWGHLAVRRPDAPGSAALQLQDEEASMFLREVSLTIFTIDGHLATSVPDVQVASLPSDTPDRGVDCEWPDGPATGGCDETSNVDRLLTLFEPSDSEF
jgi:hypothetical protein